MRPAVAATASQTRGDPPECTFRKKAYISKCYTNPPLVGGGSLHAPFRYDVEKSRAGRASARLRPSAKPRVAHPRPTSRVSLDESLPTRTSHPMTILSPSMNLYSGTSRLYGAGPCEYARTRRSASRGTDRTTRCNRPRWRLARTRGGCTRRRGPSSGFSAPGPRRLEDREATPRPRQPPAQSHPPSFGG